MTNDIYPLSKLKIKLCSKILNKSDIDYHDYLRVKNIIYNHLHIENLSPREINDLYNLGYKNLGGTLATQFGQRLKTLKEAQNATAIKTGRAVTDKKIIYKKNCQFQFSPYNEPNIKGFHLLNKYSFSSPQNKNNNEFYIHRDHMISISYGYENDIPAEYIRHPANCEILLEKDNISKGSGCSISYDELLHRIKNWGEITFIDTSSISKTSRSQSHCDNISKSLKGVSRPERRGKKHNYPKSRKSRLE